MLDRGLLLLLGATGANPEWEGESVIPDTALVMLLGALVVAMILGVVIYMLFLRRKIDDWRRRRRRRLEG